MRRIQFGAGIILIALGAAWWAAAPRLNGDRLPLGWAWHGAFVGISAYADPKTGELPEENTASGYRRSLRIVSDDRPRAVRVEDNFEMFDPQSGKTTWQYVPVFEIDPKTGRHLDPGYGGDLFVFPRWTGKTTYRLRINYVKGLPMTFRAEETIEDLSTYLFEYRGAAEYTESYAGTPIYPGVQVAPGQEIRCADDQLLLRMWVEPVTGEVVKWEEQCLSGDAIYDIASGALIASVLRWGGESAGDDVVTRAHTIASERSRLRWRFQYAPGAVLAFGVVLFALGWHSGRGPAR